MEIDEDFWAKGSTQELAAEYNVKRGVVSVIKAPAKDTRPSWNTYFLKLEKDGLVCSNCCRRKVGAVIIKDNNIISTGCNGTPV